MMNRLSMLDALHKTIYSYIISRYAKVLDSDLGNGMNYIAAQVANGSDPVVSSQEAAKAIAYNAIVDTMNSKNVDLDRATAEIKSIRAEGAQSLFEQAARANNYMDQMLGINILESTILPALQQASQSWEQFVEEEKPMVAAGTPPSVGLLSQGVLES